MRDTVCVMTMKGFAIMFWAYPVQDIVGLFWGPLPGGGKIVN